MIKKISVEELAELYGLSVEAQRPERFDRKSSQTIKSLEKAGKEMAGLKDDRLLGVQQDLLALKLRVEEQMQQINVDMTREVQAIMDLKQSQLDQIIQDDEMYYCAQPKPDAEGIPQNPGDSFVPSSRRILYGDFSQQNSMFYNGVVFSTSANPIKNPDFGMFGIEVNFWRKDFTGVSNEMYGDHKRELVFGSVFELKSEFNVETCMAFVADAVVLIKDAVYQPVTQTQANLVNHHLMRWLKNERRDDTNEFIETLTSDQISGNSIFKEMLLNHKVIA